MAPEKHNLSIPYAIPLLGESFISAGSPVIVAATNLRMRVSCTIEGCGFADADIGSLQLRKAANRALKAAGISGKLSFSFPDLQIWGQSDADLLATASCLYLAGSDTMESVAPMLLKNADDRAFIDLMRAMTSLSGGFTAGRRGEGLVSIDGRMGAFICAKLARKRRSVRPALAQFSALYPEVSEPFWHMIGHLALQGIDAIKSNDAPMLGRIMSLEARLSLAAGLSNELELMRLSRAMQSLGCKPVSCDGVSGELYLIDGVIAPPSGRLMLTFESEGVNTIG